MCTKVIGKHTKNFPGLHWMAQDLVDHFPKDEKGNFDFKTYYEPFGGKGRTAQYVRDKIGESNIMFTELSDWACDYLKSEFPKAKIVKEDYENNLIEQSRDPSKFILIDPPWQSYECYVMTETVKEYYERVLEILSDPYVKCKWMLVGSTKNGQSCKVLENSDYDNIVIYNKRNARMNGGLIGVRFIVGNYYPNPMKH